MADPIVTAIGRIDRRPSLQPRTGLDGAAVERYADALREAQAGGLPWPLGPVVAFRPAGGGRPILADGWHRLAAAELVGIGAVPVDLRPGGEVEAIEHATGANARHGVPLTRADRRRSARMLLRLDVWAARTDAVIAEHVGSTAKTVAGIRAEMVERGEIEHIAERTGRDGRTYQAAEPAPSRPSEGQAGAEADPPEPAERARRASSPRSGLEVVRDGWDQTAPDAVAERTAEALPGDVLICGVCGERGDHECIDATGEAGPPAVIPDGDDLGDRPPWEGDDGGASTGPQRYHVVALVGATAYAEVMADSPEAAVEASGDEIHTTLCHQCAGRVEVGDVYAHVVTDSDGAEVYSDDPDRRREVERARLAEALAALGWPGEGDPVAWAAAQARGAA